MMRIVGGEEAFLDLEKEAERDPTTDICVGNDEVGESASGGIASGMVDYRIGYVVNEVLVVRVGELLGGVMLDLWEDQGGERGGARSSGSGVFSQDCAVVGDTCAVDGQWDSERLHREEGLTRGVELKRRTMRMP